MPTKITSVSSSPLPVPGGGIGVGTLASNGALYGTGTTAVGATTGLTDGQLMIGSSTGVPAAASLSAGANVTITPGANSISIAAPTPALATNNSWVGDGSNVPTVTPYSFSNGVAGVITPGTSIAIAGVTATTAVPGVVQMATNAQTIAGTSGVVVNTPASLAAKLGTQTAHNVLIAEGSSSAFGLAPPVSAGYVLTDNGVGNDPTFQANPNATVIQQIRNNTTAAVLCNGLLPWDDTIPQNTEGTQVLTVTITPTNAAHILEIFFTVTGGLPAAAVVTLALFQDTTANALAAEMLANYAPGVMNGTLRFYMTAGTTSPTTFKIRIGVDNASNPFTVNGYNNARIYGGVASTWLTVTEYQV